MGGGCNIRPCAVVSFVNLFSAPWPRMPDSFCCSRSGNHSQPRVAKNIGFLFQSLVSLHGPSQSLEVGDSKTEFTNTLRALIAQGITLRR